MVGITVAMPFLKETPPAAFSILNAPVMAEDGVNRDPPLDISRVHYRHLHPSTMLSA
jgi:hypothetical protein